ncbi:MAG: exodeoxyribonuclease VII large subunit, partial [Clostridia bacterium]|nr:exodeoxyribonuclease VII large subunit [Clostridia bacterium]
MKYNPMTVTDLNLYVKEKFVQDEFLNNVLVKGEISNYKRHYTGHLYFTLKDENSLIKCVMFKGYADKLAFEPKEGSKVIVFGTVSVYERDGVYQIYTKAMEEDGVGDLYKQFQKLKEDLEKQGYFDISHKKKIPMFPKTIGVLTSKTGSVVKDIINVSTRRNPNVNLRICPVPVQGEGAAIKIAKAIKYMNDNKLADVLILARGGGSLEDLWPFNEKGVADAIYESELPIISAVGHETDFTISDFVSDLRAPTPSAAAELAVPNIIEVKEKINLYQKRLREALVKKLELMRMHYEKCMSSRVFKEPKRFIYDEYQKIDTYLKRLENSIKIRQKEEKT